MNFAKELSLDPQRLALAVDVYEGFARANSQGDTLETHVVRGSCLTIAASYASVMDVERSKKLFRSAADAYFQQARYDMAAHEQGDESTIQIHEGKMSFARVLAVCGTDATQIERFVGISRNNAASFHSPEKMASLLLAETMLEVSGHSSKYRSLRHKLMEDASRMRYYEVGRFRLPLAHFFRLAELPEELGQSRDRMRELALNVLDRVEDTTRGALDNRNWKRLQSSMLPIEPEVLALCLALDCACRKVSTGNANLLRMIGDRPQGLSRAYVDVAVEFGRRQYEGGGPRVR